MAIQNVQLMDGGQAKKEAVRGTPEATMTRWLYPTVGSMVWTYEQDINESPESNRSYHGHSAFSLGRYRNRIAYEERMSFIDMPWWFEFITDSGNLTGVTTGSTPPGYTYSPDPDGTQDVLGSFTMKLGHTGNVYKFDRCMVNRATFRFDTAGGQPDWLMTLEIWARTVTPAATFDALSERDRQPLITSIGTALYIDEPAGTIGGTQKTGYLRSGEIVIDNQLEEKFLSEDTATSSADMARGEQLFTGSLVMEFKDDIEFAKMRAGTQRKIRILKTGPNIGATPTTNYKFQLDFQDAFWMPPTQGWSGQNKIQTIGFMGYKSPSVAIPMEPEIVNASATITA